MNEEWSRHAASQIAHWAEMTKASFDCALSEYSRPCAVFRAKLSLDGDQWCALLGENLMEGVAGFGKTPAEAMWDFDKQFCTAAANQEKGHAEPT